MKKVATFLLVLTMAAPAYATKCTGTTLPSNWKYDTTVQAPTTAYRPEEIKDRAVFSYVIPLEKSKLEKSPGQFNLEDFVKWDIEKLKQDQPGGMQATFTEDNTAGENKNLKILKIDQPTLPQLSYRAYIAGPSAQGKINIAMLVLSGPYKAEYAKYETDYKNWVNGLYCLSRL